MQTSRLFNALDERPDDTLYSTFNRSDAPMLLLGTMINNAYDHYRVEIKPQHDPIRIKIKTDTHDKYLYGVRLNPNRRFMEVQSRVTSVPVDHEQYQHMYRERVKLYGLSCDNCWALTNKNIFPLDVANIDKLSINTKYMTRPETIFETTDHENAWFTKHVDPKLFILKYS